MADTGKNKECSRETALRELQDAISLAIPAGTSLNEELIRERHAEAARELDLSAGSEESSRDSGDGE